MYLNAVTQRRRKVLNNHKIKLSELLHPVLEFQPIFFLKTTNKKLAFRRNINAPVFKFGFKRHINNY